LKKKRNKARNLKHSNLTTHTHIQNWGNTKEGKFVYLNLVFLDMKIIKSKLAYLHQCKQQDGGSSNQKINKKLTHQNWNFLFLL
jgi:hypothetical protein